MSKPSVKQALEVHQNWLADKRTGRRFDLFQALREEFDLTNVD